ncbi:glycosyltransferase family 4 protein [Cognatishimia activa]|uniref:glycosyltransferase family 4 protein n=1 Tax=Cognatishimia activa TaxID=1715691 RepID=UPI00222EAACF|nr:glycosyltransferase family 4 protein [Cognatishimia activa]UZD89716.1 glycosyltransferase family 4 protein [Cognatishimia activa]
MNMTVTHLLDDATPGGVTRVIEGLQSSETLGKQAKHELQMVANRGRWPVFHSEVIVSHLALNWRNLPTLMTLRAQHPHAALIHVEHSYTQRFTALNVSNRDRFYTLLRTAYALFDQVVCVSRAQGSWMATRALVDAPKLRIIRSSVALDELANLPAPKGNPHVLGLIGRLHVQKGFDQAIAAFQKLEDPDLRLKIFGTGNEQKALVAQAGSDPRITFEGFCETAKAMAQIDALVVPSRWEAFGLVAQEALAAGRAVLVAPVDGLLDQIQDGAQSLTGVGIASLSTDMKRLVECPVPNATQNRPKLARLNQQRFENGWLQLIEDMTVKHMAAA